MIPALTSYDWEQAFCYASGVALCGSCALPEPAAPGIEVSCAPFNCADVEELFGIEEGENDGPDWICYGRLRDGRFFSLAAGCDYTGWD